MDTKELHKIAARTRRWLFRTLRKEGATYNGDINVAGYCAVATAKLLQNLNDPKAKPCFVCSGDEAHAFVIYSTKEDDLIIDITADQFGEKPIVIKSIDEKDLPWYWCGENYNWCDDNEEDEEQHKIVTDVKEFLKEVKDWGIQSPQHFKIDLKMEVISESK